MNCECQDELGDILSQKTDKYKTNIYVFTALIHCTLCSDCCHIIFVSFQAVVCFFVTE